MMMNESTSISGLPAAKGNTTIVVGNFYWRQGEKLVSGNQIRDFRLDRSALARVPDLKFSSLIGSERLCNHSDATRVQLELFPRP